MSQEIFPDSPADYFLRIKEMVYNMLGYRPPKNLSFDADRPQSGSSHAKDNDDGVHLELREDSQRAAGKVSSPNEMTTVAPWRRIVSCHQTSYGTPPVEALIVGEKRTRETSDDNNKNIPTKLPKRSAAHPSITNVSFLAMVEDFDSDQED